MPLGSMILRRGMPRFDIFEQFWNKVRYTVSHTPTWWGPWRDDHPGEGDDVSLSPSGHPVSTAQDVASYMVWHTQTHGDTITNLKLQKLLYYAYGWYLAFYDRELFRDPIRAWVRGPAVHEVWRRYNHYGWQPIAARATKPNLDEHTANHIEEVLRAYGNFSALSLEDMTHKERPWLMAREGIAPKAASTVEIDKKVIREHFAHLARKAESRREKSA